jgi:hypothetical protein
MYILNCFFSYLFENQTKPGHNFMLLTACFDEIKIKSIFYLSNVRLPVSIKLVLLILLRGLHPPLAPPL